MAIGALFTIKKKLHHILTSQLLMGYVTCCVLNESLWKGYVDSAIHIYTYTCINHTWKSMIEELDRLMVNQIFKKKWFSRP